MAIWTDAQLEGWELQAFEELSAEIPMILSRISFNITAGIATYEVPQYSQIIGSVVGIQRITWKGKRLTALSRAQFRELHPTVLENVVSEGLFSESVFDLVSFDVRNVTTSGPAGVPEYYSFSGTSWNTIQFYSTPNETIAASTGDMFSMPEIRNAVIATVYTCTSDYSLFPNFNMRSFVVPYVLWKAFLNEGPGQRLDLAEYWKDRFSAGVEVLRKINSGVFISKRHSMRDPGISPKITSRRALYRNSDDIPRLG